MKTLIIGIGILAGSAINAVGAQYSDKANTETDKVMFNSTATLEFIQGKTNRLIGSFVFDPDHPESDVTGKFQVDLASLKTGIDLRDEHMREKHLHTDKYPFAYFELLSVSGMPPTILPGQTYSAVGDGYFYIHGVKRRIRPAVEFTIAKQGTPDNQIQIRAKFSLKLDDYRIQRPKALFMKLAETLDISVIFSGHNDLPVSDFQLPPWEEIK